MKLLPTFMSKRPLIAEHDLSGVIVDANGTEFSNDDQVFGFISVELSNSTQQGALAQYVRMPASHLVKRPDNLSVIEAAGITLAAQTAYQALLNCGHLEAGQTVLINGGSSSVGAFAIQIAKILGAKVVATASGKNEQFVRDQGADEFIDYTKVSLPQYLASNPPSPKYHLIFDAVALVDPSLYTYSSAYLAPNGVFVTSGPLPKNSSEIWQMVKHVFAAFTPKWLGGISRAWTFIALQNNKADLETLQKYIAEGKLKPVVDSVYEFEDVLKAYDRMISGRATGKIVVKVDPTVT